MALPNGVLAQVEDSYKKDDILLHDQEEENNKLFAILLDESVQERKDQTGSSEKYINDKDTDMLQEKSAIAIGEEFSVKAEFDPDSNVRPGGYEKGTRFKIKDVIEAGKTYRIHPIGVPFEIHRVSQSDLDKKFNRVCFGDYTEDYDPFDDEQFKNHLIRSTD